MDKNYSDPYFDSPGRILLRDETGCSVSEAEHHMNLQLVSARSNRYMMGVFKNASP